MQTSLISKRILRSKKGIFGTKVEKHPVLGPTASPESLTGEIAANPSVITESSVLIVTKSSFDDRRL